jgi:hypothetical protein
MLTTRLLKISLLLPLMAISATAYAGSTITDKSYWPSEAKRSAQTGTGNSQSDLSSAFAYDRAASRLQPATIPNYGGSSPRYQGGPKSQMTHAGGR